MSNNKQEIKDYYQCYFHKRNSQAFAVNMIVFGSRTFVNSKHIKELEHLQNLVLFQNKKLHTKETEYEMANFVLNTLLDWVSITICFENFMKAVLMLHGYLIHKIDRNDKKLKTLGNQQNKRPIKLSEYLNYYNFSIELESRQYILEGIKGSTEISKK